MSESDMDAAEIGNGAGPRTLAPALPKRNPSGADAVREADFPVVLRGYDRRAVDDFLGELADLIDVLDARQAREGVVQHALDEVGEQTSTILKHAHELADEVTARSRAQAEDRLELARREAEEIVAEAHAEAVRLERDTDEVWKKREALLEDLRVLGGEAVALAGQATDRLPRPLPEAVVEEAGATEVIEPGPASVVDLPTEEWPADEAPEDGGTGGTSVR
jgi:DivIVA domain-containing protein